MNKNFAVSERCADLSRLLASRSNAKAKRGRSNLDVISEQTSEKKLDLPTVPLVSGRTLPKFLNYYESKDSFKSENQKDQSKDCVTSFTDLNRWSAKNSVENEKRSCKNFSLPKTCEPFSLPAETANGQFQTASPEIKTARAFHTDRALNKARSLPTDCRLPAAPIRKLPILKRDSVLRIFHKRSHLQKQIKAKYQELETPSEPEKTSKLIASSQKRSLRQKSGSLEPVSKARNFQNQKLKVSQLKKVALPFHKGLLAKKSSKEKKVLERSRSRKNEAKKKSSQ